MDHDLITHADLPLTGWTARLHYDGDRPDRLVVGPLGGSPLTHSLLAATGSDRGQSVLGAHHVRLARPFGPSAVGTVTLAYGVLGNAPVEVVLLRHRHWRPARVQRVRPVVLADRVWWVEQAGHYDEVRATVSGRTTVRLV
ncbi:hypothetical protein [Actinomadura hibisca]|uniref:hypothetical protein n=1 Tax=Actinomadura hibisca TaxID=68565 RepID=UPI000835B8D0|nr:hypothetical protein [Actinomadura hibisca]